MSTRNVPAGRWMKVQGMLESVAVPEMSSPPPLCQPSARVTFHHGTLRYVGAVERHAWVQCWRETHNFRSPSRDVQPDQFGPASGRDIDDPPRSLGVEHDAPGHLRLDGHVAVDAERRTALVGAHVVVELVGTRYQHDPAHRIIFERFTEFARADRVPRARLLRRRGRRGR
eukprot:scaffold5059_cov72-Phaeocystis_antarctica.AAC.2